MARKEPTSQEIVDDWNANHKVGAAVILKRGNQDFRTGTKTEAVVIFDTAMIAVEGLSGFYDLEKVTAI